MFKAIRRLIAIYRDLKKQRDCAHEWCGPVTVAGGWSEPIPHPHPLFRDLIKVHRQQYAEVRVCFKCRKVSATFKYNQKDLSPPDDTQKENPSYSPQRVFDANGRYIRDA